MTRFVAMVSLLALVSAASTIPTTARAQNPQPAAPGTTPPPVAPPNAAAPPPEQLAPGARDGKADDKPNDGSSLSDRLSRDRGTVTPPRNVDPGIAVPPPVTNQGTMPVIPPPGTPGGNQRVVPK